MKEINDAPEQQGEGKIAFKLLDYVNGVLPNEEQWEMEELMNADSAISDAIEGLKQFEYPAEIIPIQQSLNKGILSKTFKKKRNRFKPIQFPFWIILVIIILMLIGLAGLGIIQLLK
ncbi:MAG: hypothetical protein RLZZ172_2971 [Bacteroidota bacterium]|jgi:hypothetical protein